MFLLLEKPSLVADEATAYMNADQRAYFKGLLMRMKAETLSIIHNTDLAEREDMADPLDRSAQEQDRVAEARGMERNLKQVNDIDQALKRIEAEEYGYCADTGEEIGIARLLVSPTTMYSVEALQIREVRSRTHGGH